MLCIKYENKDYRQINFNINVRTELSSINDRLEKVEIDGLKISKDLLFHSVTELINNSIGAHEKHQISDPIHLQISIIKEGLKIIISDKGRGFDISQLPYNLDDPVSAIDINGKNFQIYREKSNYKRFGTGLFNAKKTFDKFELYFVDEIGNRLPYDSRDIEGTIIELLLEEGVPEK